LLKTLNTVEIIMCCSFRLNKQYWCNLLEAISCIYDRYTWIVTNPSQLGSTWRKADSMYPATYIETNTCIRSYVTMNIKASLLKNILS